MPDSFRPLVERIKKGQEQASACMALLRKAFSSIQEAKPGRPTKLPAQGAEISLTGFPCDDEHCLPVENKSGVVSKRDPLLLMLVAQSSDRSSCMRKENRLHTFSIPSWRKATPCSDNSPLPSRGTGREGSCSCKSSIEHGWDPDKSDRVHALRVIPFVCDLRS
eukprot:scaffold113_cov339-Pavlova_lutheri.AAC.20